MKFMRTGFLVLILALAPASRAVPVETSRLMVSGPSPIAVETAKKIYAKGGNVVDVAVAVALTLAVTSPYYAALGGGGFAMVRMDGSVQALDFRETAPAAADKDFYKDATSGASITGGKAVGIPGIPAGLWALHQKFGKLKWAQLFDQAIELALSGYPVSGEWASITQNEKGRLSDVGRDVFLKKNLAPYRPGELFKQAELAKALREFKTKNLKGFYEGAVADDIVKSVAESGGQISAADLKGYKVRWLTPLTAEFEGYKIYLMPPPSSGGVIISTALSLIDRLKLREKPLLSVDELHFLGEIESRAFRGRTLLGDPDFTKNPIEFLTSAAYLDELTKSVTAKQTSYLAPLADRDQPKEKAETTHFSVMDAEGHSVAMTLTLNGGYGSGVVSRKFHIALNNEMDDFNTKSGVANQFGLIHGEANSIQPGKRPLSSMSPTLVEKNGKLVMSLGAPGGPRIISSVLQVLYRTLGQKMDLDLAVQSPRVHHQFMPSKLYLEPKRFSPEIVEALKARKHIIEESGGGKVFAIQQRADGTLEGVYDMRGEGAAGGL